MSDASGFMKKNRGLTIFTVAVTIYLYAPIALLVLFSFNDSPYVAFPLKAVTFKWYQQMAENSQLLASIGNSFKVAVVASVLSVLIATLAAKALTQKRFFGKTLMAALISAPVVMPEVIVGLAMLIVLVQALGLQLSLFTVTLGHIVVCTPYALAIMISRFSGYDPAYDEASLDLGEGPFMTFFRVTLPIVWPGIISSLLLAFLISFDDFVVSFFLTGTDQTLPIFIWSAMRFPLRLPQVLALGVLVLLGSIVVVAFAEILQRRGKVKDV